MFRGRRRRCTQRSWRCTGWRRRCRGRTADCAARQMASRRHSNGLFYFLLIFLALVSLVLLASLESLVLLVLLISLISLVLLVSLMSLVLLVLLVSSCHWFLVKPDLLFADLQLDWCPGLRTWRACRGGSGYLIRSSLTPCLLFFRGAEKQTEGEVLLEIQDLKVGTSSPLLLLDSRWLHYRSCVPLRAGGAGEAAAGQAAV